MAKGKVGRPKKGTSWTELIREYADRPDETGQTRKKKIIYQLLRLAEGGEQWAIREVLDRLEGKAVQRSAVLVGDNAETLNASISFNVSSTLEPGQPDQVINVEPNSTSDNEEKIT